MERYEGNTSLAAFFGLTGILLLCFAVFVISQAIPQVHTFNLLEGAAGILGMGGLGAAGVFLLWGAGEASASFSLEDQGITRRSWGRRTFLAWGDLDGLEESSPTGHKWISDAFGRLFLYGRDGRRMAIRFHFVVDGSQLRARLEQRLVGLREESLRTLAKHGGSFRPSRSVGLLMMTTMVPLFLIGGVCGLDLAESGRAKDSPATWYIGILAVAASPFLAMLALELMSRKLTVSPTGLALRSIFLDRFIPFADIASIDVKMNHGGDGPAVESARIRAVDGQKIALDSTMPGYRAVVEIARKSVGAKSCVAGVIDPELC